MRPYQEQAIWAVWNSVIHQGGLSFVWIFPRQSGKDEALALLVQVLLVRSMQIGGEIVFFNPTFTPQSDTSMRRLADRLDSNLLTRGLWKRKSGYIYRLNRAHCTYMSAEPEAHVVSATANLLLIVNEAQDVEIHKYDKDISPMAGSTNATRLFAGTRWTPGTLLEREYRHAIQFQEQDGRRRAFLFTADDVRQSVPAYGNYVDGEIDHLGRQHPMVKTQFFSEEIDAQAGMFPPGRQALMKGDHPARTAPEPGKTYAFLIDVAGQDETPLSISDLEMGRAGVGLGQDQGPLNPSRDSTFLKIVEIDLSTVPLLGKPTYKVVFRKAWLGQKHVIVFGALHALGQTWKPARMVIDATGVGEGLWSLLDNAFGSNTVRPVKFTPQLKSDLGYGLLAIVESGRYREYHPFDDTLRLQLDKCRSEIVPGPSKWMRWSVPDGTRASTPQGHDQATSEFVHDDDLITAALCAELDKLDWSIQTTPLIVPGIDPLPFMERNF